MGTGSAGVGYFEWCVWGCSSVVVLLGTISWVLSFLVGWYNTLLLGVCGLFWIFGV